MSGASDTYEITFEERPGYLYALVRSTSMTVEMALDYLTQVAAKRAALSVHRLMLERDVPVMLNDLDLYHTTKYFLNQIKGTKVAFVNPHSQIDDDMDFAVLIGVNEGANYRLFDNPASAEEWLLK